jgi:ribosomal-protein-alanine N-acetyltransferase
MWPFNRQQHTDQTNKAQGQEPPAADAELRRIVAIEKASFNDPWPAAEFVRYLTNSLISTWLYKGKIVGYLCVSHNRRGWWIDNMAVHPRYRRQGVASSLLQHLSNTVAPGGRIACAVTEANLVTQLLLRSLGFRCVGIQHGYYSNGANAYIFRWQAPTASTRDRTAPGGVDDQDE